MVLFAGVLFASASGPPPPPDPPSAPSSSHTIAWPLPSALHSCISGVLLGVLLLSAGALLCHNGYRSLGRLSHRYGMTPIELLAVLRRHAIDARILVLVVAIANPPWPWS